MKKVFDISHWWNGLFRVVIALVLVTIALPMSAESFTFKGYESSLKVSVTGATNISNELKHVGVNGDYSYEVYFEIEEGRDYSISANGAKNHRIFLQVGDWEGTIFKKDSESGSISMSGKARKTDKSTFQASVIYHPDVGLIKVEMFFTVKPKSKKDTKKAPAAQSYKGTMTGLGSKMEYSFSGGTVTNKSDVRYGGTDLVNMNIFADGEVAPEASVTASCKNPEGGKYFNEVYATIYAILNDGSTKKLKEKTQVMSATVSATVPKNAKQLKMEMGHKGRMGKYACFVTWDVKKEASASSPGSFNWDDTHKRIRCSKCNGQFSNYFVNNFVGTVGIMCNSDSKKESRLLDDSFSKLEPIYYNDYIYTGNDDWLLLDNKDDKEVLKILGGSKVLLQKRLANGSDRWVVYKGKIVGKSLKRAAEPSFQMTNCIATPTGTTYVLEDDGKTSRVMLLDGSMEVVSNKGSKKQTLHPGQAATVTNNGQINVGNFDVAATAKKYGISGVSIPKTSTQQTNTKTTGSTVQQSTNNDNTIYDVAATQPEYPGGQSALMAFLQKNIKYPADAKQKGVDGRVLVQFVVEKDGTLSDIKVARKGKLPSLDAEALRVVKLIKGFKAGRNEKNQPVRVKYSLPVSFILP